MTAHIFFFFFFTVRSHILTLEVYMQIQRHSGCANTVHHQGKMHNFIGDVEETSLYRYELLLIP